MISSLELARLCGVSQGTVDRAMHDRPGISTVTRGRILAMAERHGYRPNPAVLEVMRGTSRTIGALVPAIDSPFFLDLMNEVRKAVAPSGLRLLLAQVDNEREFHEALGDFAARRAAGVVVVPPAEGIRLRSELDGALPVVSFVAPCLGPSVRFLSPDEHETGRTATFHLLGLGHRRIVHLSYHRRAHGIVAREAGYRSAMIESGLEATVIHGPDDGLIAAMARDGRATAFFCLNDWQALSVIRALGDTGMSVPVDVSVLGVDASPTFTGLYPGITTLAYPFRELAAIAAKALAGVAKLPAIPACAIVPGKTVRALG